VPVDDFTTGADSSLKESDSMSVRCESYDDVCVISVEGDLTGDNVQSLRQTAEERMQSHASTDFVVDMEKCDFLDSEGLETLLWLKRRCDERSGQAKLASLDENCRKIMEITRLVQCFECHSDVSSALRVRA
jgi:anti-anti-sigma factor